jgi:hypothetical protein
MNWIFLAEKPFETQHEKISSQGMIWIHRLT